MEKFWIKNYPTDVPANIDPEEFSSITDYLRSNFTEYADQPAFENLGTQITYQELLERSMHFAAYLQKQLHLVKGDRIAIMLPNILQYPITLLAALQLGLIIVNINPLYTPRELIYPLKDSNAKAIVVLANFASTLEQVINNTEIKHVILTELGDEFPTLKRLFINCYLKYIKKAFASTHSLKCIPYLNALNDGAKESLDIVQIEPTDIAFLQYTGGTTGIPKGAMLTHRNIIANIIQCVAWIGHVLEKGREVVITALPLYHIFSLTICCFSFMKLGGVSLLITNPRDIKSLIKVLKTPFTVFVGVNTLYQALLQHSSFKGIDFKSMKLALAGGMSVTKKIAEEWQEATGKAIIMGYGLTEASPVVAINPLTLNHFSGSIGLPVPSTDIAILNDAGEEVPLGSPGELCLKGPQVMLGYWHQPEESRNVLNESGWLRTGDIAMMDGEGYIYLIDRKKDMILVSGFNVYPNEIEEVIGSHPRVAEVAVIGVPNDLSGEIVKAFIVKKDSELTEDEVRLFCKQNLTGYKQPKEIEFCTELPKSNVGKILRQKLREASILTQPS